MVDALKDRLSDAVRDPWQMAALAILGSAVLAVAILVMPLSVGAGLAGGLLFVVVMAQNPDLMLALIILMTPFQSKLPEHLNLGGGLNAMNLAMFFMLGLWLLRKHNGRFEEIRNNPMTWVFLSFYLMIFLSILRSVHWMGWGIVPQLINPAKRWILPTLMFYPIAVSKYDEKKLRWLVLAIGLAVLLMATDSLKQFHSMGFSHYSDDARMGGPFGKGGENDLAAFFVYYFPLLAATAFFDKNFVRRVYLYGVVLLSFVAILLTYSRGAYLGAVAALIFLGVTKKRGWLIVAIVLALSYRFWVPASVTQRVEMTEQHMVIEEPGEIVVPPTAIENNFEKSTALRITIWKGALKMIRDYPIEGFGFQMFERLMMRYTEIAYPMDTHNMYLRTAVEHGLPGLGIFLLLWIVPFVTALRFYGKATLPLSRGVALGVVAGILGIAIVNLWGSRFFREELVGLYWIMLGILYRLKTIESRELSVARETSVLHRGNTFNLLEAHHEN